MGLYVAVHFECDECSWDETSGESKARAVADMRADGWRIGKRVVCPSCASPDAS